MGQTIDIGAELRHIGKTGEADSSAFPEDLTNKLLFVLDEVFDSNEDRCLQALDEVIAKAQRQGKPALEAIDEWTRNEMNNINLESVCEQFL